MDADLARFATGDGTSSARTAGGTGATSSTGMDYTSSGSRHPGFRPVAMPPGFMLPGVYGAQPPARMAPPMMMSPWGMPYGMHGALHGYPPMMMPPIPPPPLGVHPASARYMVQDLTTGQQVFLDPRFNVYPGQGPPMGGSAGQFMGSAGPSGTGATGTEPSYSTLHDSLSDGEDHTVPNPHLEGTSRPYGTGSRASGQTTEPAPGGDAPGEDQGAEEQGERVSDGGGTGEGKDGSGEGSNEGSDRASGRGSGDGAGRECGEQGGANVVGKASAGPEPAPGTEAPASDAGPAKATCGGSSAMRSPREAPPAHKRVSLDVEDLVVDKRPSKHLHKECP